MKVSERMRPQSIEYFWVERTACTD